MGALHDARRGASTGPRSRERGERLNRGNTAGSFTIASTGPRSRERGEVVERVRQTAVSKASTGPRSRERGEPKQNPPAHRYHLAASTGPRSRERGEGLISLDVEYVTTLQRGHAHVSVERPPAFWTNEIQFVLQRGHAHVSVESGLPVQMAEGRNSCFNGATLT